MLGLEVLELYEGPGPPQLDGGHELVHEGVILVALQPVLPVAQVPGVFLQLGVIGAHVEDAGQDTLGVEAPGRYIQVKLSWDMTA